MPLHMYFAIIKISSMPSNVAQRPRLPTCPHQPLSQGPGSSSQFQWTKDSNTSRSQRCRWVAKMTSPGFDNVTLKDEMSIKSEPYHMWTNLCNLFCSQTIPTCIHPYTCSIPLWPLWDFGRQVATVALERLQQWRSGRGSKPIKVFQGDPTTKHRPQPQKVNTWLWSSGLFLTFL